MTIFTIFHNFFLTGFKIKKQIETYFYWKKLQIWHKIQIYSTLKTLFSSLYICHNYNTRLRTTTLLFSQQHFISLHNTHKK